MSIKKKLFLCNIIMVCVPLCAVMVMWLFYSSFSGRLKTGKTEEDQMYSILSDVQKTLYLYEVESEDMEWEKISENATENSDYLPTESMQKIEELADAGYHFHVKKDETLLFDNLDLEDKEILNDSEMPEKEGYLISKDNAIVIHDILDMDNARLMITAVYRPERADKGVDSSLIPIYMLPSYMVFVFVVVVLLSVVVTGLILARWVGYSMLTPLTMLMKGTREIAEGNLEYEIQVDTGDELGVLGRDFDRMRRKLKSSEEERNEYENNRRELLAGISHDLRSPLTSIKGYAMGLKDGIADTQEKRERYYDAILTRSEDMERLTHSLSYLTKLENGESILHMESVCLDEYLKQFLQEKASYTEEKKVRIDYNNSIKQAEVRLDLSEMKRVFTNLLENSVRYRTKDTSVITLSVDLENDNVVVQFKDDGPGVPEQYISHIFDRFFRVDASRTNPGQGSGLGLAIVKQIVEGHEGTVSAYNEEGLGIVIKLPVLKGME